jgi:uncharacterized membrane protein
MKLKLADATSLIAIGGLLLLAAYLVPQIPDPMPVRWNSDEIAVGFSSRLVGLTMALGLPMVAFVLLKYLPRISPRGFRIDRFQHVYDIVVMASTLTLVVTSAMTILIAAGRDVPVGALRSVVLGSLFLVLGNYLGKFRRNFFAGIRTPWTLASEEVWARTHRVGGWLFVMAGLAVLATAIRPRLFLPVVLAATLGASIVSVVYSLILYWRLHGFGSSTD